MSRIFKENVLIKSTFNDSRIISPLVAILETSSSIESQYYAFMTMFHLKKKHIEEMQWEQL
jgi:hypothetical protein